jgi:hypothetical protein
MGTAMTILTRMSIGMVMTMGMTTHTTTLTHPAAARLRC